MLEIILVVLTLLTIVARWLRSGQTLAEFSWLGLTRIYAKLWHRWSSNGPAPWPSQGPALIVANHTCSSDPMFLVAGGRRFVSFVVAREHYNVSTLTRRILELIRCVPATRDGRDVGAARGVLERLRAGCLVCIFPEGNLSGVARNCQRPWKHSAALFALLTGVPVFPAYIAGGPRTRKLLRAWLRPSRRAVHVTYGSAIDLSTYSRRKRTRQLLEEVTQLLRDRVRSLSTAKEGQPWPRGSALPSAS